MKVRLLLLAAALTATMPAAAQAALRPNIVFILVDDLRFDDLACTGHPWVKTPHIDRIAREGALFTNAFTNAFTTSPLCSPSRGCILTGLYAHAHGITDNTDRSAQSHKLVTFPRLLHEAAILHLIEHGLRGEKGYALDQKATVEFSGVLADLPPALGKHVPGIGGITGGDNTTAFNDYVTKVTVRSKKQPIREILTNCVPLDGYNPILWFASTSTNGGKLKTMVQYTGHLREWNGLNGNVANRTIDPGGVLR